MNETKQQNRAEKERRYKTKQITHTTQRRIRASQCVVSNKKRAKQIIDLHTRLNFILAFKTDIAYNRSADDFGVFFFCCSALMLGYKRYSLQILLGLREDFYYCNHLGDAIAKMMIFAPHAIFARRGNTEEKRENKRKQRFLS